MTIAAGTNFKFKSGGGIRIASNHPATFKAVGTSTNPIVFTSSLATPQPGNWKFVRFDSYLNANSELNYCNFSYGGSDTYYKGLVTIGTTTNLTVQNCSFSNSQRYGLYNMNGGSPANSDWQTVNTFSNNGEGNYN